jgi:hypothetical protein
MYGSIEFQKWIQLHQPPLQKQVSGKINPNRIVAAFRVFVWK